MSYLHHGLSDGDDKVVILQKAEPNNPTKNQDLINYDGTLKRNRGGGGEEGEGTT